MRLSDPVVSVSYPEECLMTHIRILEHSLVAESERLLEGTLVLLSYMLSIPHHDTSTRREIARGKEKL